MHNPKLIRSLLFVPATSEKLLESAVRRGADAVQLDLEDAIAVSEKERARQAAVEAIAWLQGRSPYIVARINSPLRLAVRDLEAIVLPGLQAITVPKVPDAFLLRLLDKTMQRIGIEARAACRRYTPECYDRDGGGVGHVDEIAGATRSLIALTVGPEDLVASLGSQATPDAMYLPNMLALIAARRVGSIPLGYIGSVSLFGDKQTYRTSIQRASSLALMASFDPTNQVEICNEVFLPSPEASAEARQLIEAYEKHQAEGVGVFVVDGRMIDAPVVERARTIVAKAEALASRDQ